MADDWGPCRHIDYGEAMGDPRYGIMFDEFGQTQEVLEAKGLMGGGYTWHGIVEAMIRTKHPEFAADISYDPEGSMFCARSSNLVALRCVAASIREALTDPIVLEEAIRNADKSIME